MTTKIYLVWNDDVDEQFWSLYDSIADAISDKGNGCEVFLAKPKRLGNFKSVNKIIKVTKRKKVVR